jgi:hypothetical protein
MVFCFNLAMKKMDWCSTLLHLVFLLVDVKAEQYYQLSFLFFSWCWHWHWQVFLVPKSGENFGWLLVR